jgi:ATP-dependent protease ClpP protease subunit
MKTWYRLRANRKKAELLIYDEIGVWGKSSMDLIHELNGLGEDLTALDVRINSPGGDVFEALAIHNALAHQTAKITTHVDSLCASAATLVALAADEVRMSDNAMWMIHEPWTFAMGNSGDLQKQADVLDTLSEKIVNIYARKTGADAETVREWMQAETWYDAQQALDAGFVDAVDQPLKIAAMVRQHDVHQFANYPRGMKMTQATEPVAPEELTEPAAPAESPAGEAPVLPVVPGPEAASPLDAVAVARLCLDAHEPGLTPILLATPQTDAQVKARLAQAAAVRRICAAARQPELADRLVAAGLDEAGAMLATWERLVARAEASPVDNTPPAEALAALPLPERCAAEWNQTPQLRAEFGTLEIYQAYCNAVAKGQAAILRSKEL